MRILILLLLIPTSAYGESHICYFSFNNEKEFVETEKFLKKLNKHSKEKITVSEYQTDGTNPERSFEKLLKSGTKCDGIVFSGHHTGSFGGKRASGSLGLDFLEKAACDPKYSDFFSNIKGVWLQGCRTLGQKITVDQSAPEDSADYHRARVGAVLAEDHLEQSFAQLEMEFSATLDEDNPLSSRYLRVFPRATVFGWTATAPGEKARSEYSLLYHIAHMSRISDDRGKYFEDPTKNLSEETAVNYISTILAVLKRDEFVLAPDCNFISEQDMIDGWLSHGQAKLGEDGRPLPLSYANPDLQAFPALASNGNIVIKRAKELDCMLKKNLSKRKLNAVIDEIVSDVNLLGYNFNALWAHLQKLKKAEDNDRLNALRNKLHSSEVLTGFLSRKLNSKTLGSLQKIDYYAFYRDMTGKRNRVLENHIREKSEKLLSSTDYGDDNQRDYASTLIKSLAKNGLLVADGDTSMVKRLVKDYRIREELALLFIHGDIGGDGALPLIMTLTDNKGKEKGIQGAVAKNAGKGKCRGVKQCDLVKKIRRGDIDARYKLEKANLQNMNLKKIDLSFAEMDGSNLEGASLRGSDLQHAKLRKAKMSYSDLRLARFLYTDLSESDLSGSDLKGARFNHAVLRRTNMSSSDLRLASLYKADLSEADLSGADLREAFFHAVNLEGADLSGADLRMATIYQGNLKGANLGGADLRRATLYETNLEGANLSGTDLRGAIFSESNLEGADLSGADLRWTTLYETNLEGADLGGADLGRADLRRASLGGATNWESANFEGALYDKNTVFPGGFDPVKAGMILDES